MFCWRFNNWHASMAFLARLPDQSSPTVESRSRHKEEPVRRTRKPASLVPFPRVIPPRETVTVTDSVGYENADALSGSETRQCGQCVLVIW